MNMALFLLSVLLLCNPSQGSPKTSVFINPDSPFFVKQTPNGEILLRKSPSYSSSRPSFNALNELLDLYLRNQTLRSSLRRNDFLSSKESFTTTPRPYYPFPSTTTHGPFFTFSSTDFGSNLRREKDRVSSGILSTPPSIKGYHGGLKPFQVVTLSPYKSIVEDESRNKWPLYNLSSFKGKNRISTSSTNSNSDFLGSAETTFVKEDDELDLGNIFLSPAPTDSNIIFDDKFPTSQKKEPSRVIVNRPGILTISEFLPGPVIVTNNQDKILDTATTGGRESMKTSTTERPFYLPTRPSTDTATTEPLPFSLASFVAFEPIPNIPSLPTTTSTTTTTTTITTEVVTGTTVADTTTESSQFGLSNIFSMISNQMEIISNSFLQTKTSTASADLSVAGSSSSSSTSTSGGGGALDPSAALIPALLGGVIGVGLFVSELAKASSLKRRRLSGGPIRGNYASTKAVDLFRKQQGGGSSRSPPQKRKKPYPRKMKSSTVPLRRSGITQFVAADAKRAPQPNEHIPGNFYYDYLNSDVFVNTNQ